MKRGSALNAAILLTLLTILVAASYVIASIKALKVLEALSCLLFPLGIERGVRMWQDVSDNSSWKSSLRAHIRGGFLKREERIRISFAYLFRIMIDGKYFLVKNNRGTDRFQPVGGAYKCHESEKHFLTNEFHVVTDDQVPVDETSKNDYRMRVQVKNLKKFIRRFDKTKERELLEDLSREFNEEVNKELKLGFTEIHYTYCGRDITPVQFSKYFQCYEILLADIVNLDLDAQQYEQFRMLMNEETDYFHFASAKEIEHCGVTPGSKDLRSTISDHSGKILESYAINLIIKKKQKKEYKPSLAN